MILMGACIVFNCMHDLDAQNCAFIQLKFIQFSVHMRKKD